MNLLISVAPSEMPFGSYDVIFSNQQYTYFFIFLAIAFTFWQFWLQSFPQFVCENFRPFAASEASKSGPITSTASPGLPAQLPCQRVKLEGLM